MGNLIAKIKRSPREKAEDFIERHSDVWPVILNKVRMGRMLNKQSYIDDANDIYAPLIEADGYGFDGEIEVARELWRIIQAETTPPVKPEDDITPL